MSNESKKEAVRNRYAAVAETEASGCCGETSCCGDPGAAVKSSRMGYSVEEMDVLPEGANLGLGCGNPTALAGIKEGEIVVDLGSGAGIDCFLAARRVGPSGRVIGVDMTHEMLSRARNYAEKENYGNVEFRLGEIEHLPVADAEADLIISNCVINLSTDKAQVFSEAFRVLKPGGRLAVSDIVLNGELHEAVRNNDEAYCSCISGALERNTYLDLIRAAGFEDIRIETESPYGDDLVVKTEEEEVAIPKGVVVSVSVTAVKPLAAGSSRE